MSSTPEKADALVLRVVPFSETSAIVMLFTREFGRMSGMAKGARRPKGPFEAALDLLARCRIVFLRKSSDALDLLTEAKLERRFRPADRDLSSLYAGYYVAELLRELTDDDDPHPELFDAACQTLAALSQGGAAVTRETLHFELSALRVLGHLPSLNDCVECGQAVAAAPQARVAFGLLAGGVLCTQCRSGKRQVVSVRGSTLKTMQLFATEGTAWQTIEPDRGTLGELRGLVNQYLSNLLGHRPRMHRYLSVVAPAAAATADQQTA